MRYTNGPALHLWQQFASWTVLSVVLGLLLLAAAALKGHEIATAELLEDSLLSSRWFLMLVVEWEIFSALWLLGGLYRSYPWTTHCVALLYFFVLFVVAMDSVLKGRPSCPCFGKAIVPPWVAAGIDLVALLLLAATPVQPACGEVQQLKQRFGLAGAFAVFGLLSMITMGDYSTSGVVPGIRKDSRLFASVVTIQRVRPKTEEFLDLLRNATGLYLTVDSQLLTRQPDYGVWDLKKIQPWAVMELLAARQKVPARWEKVDDGYVMVPAAPFGKSQLFWSGSAALMALSMLVLRGRVVVKVQRKALSGAADEETSAVTDLRAAKCC